LNEGTVAGDDVEQDRPPDLVDLRDDDLKNNKAAGSDSIVAELLKNGGHNWMHYTSKSSWPGLVRLYPKAGSKGYCDQYRRLCKLSRNRPALRGIHIVT
jgi:hypothetical protein